MSWETRQNRLRGLFGSNTDYCFQMCIGLTRHAEFSSEEEVHAVANDYGIRHEDERSITLRKRNYTEDPFNACYIYNGPTKKFGSLLDTEVLVSLSPYKLNSSDPYDRKTWSDLESLVKLYIPAIEEKHGDFVFGDNLYADGNSRAVDFKFIIQPYSPELCHPRELNQLKPITILGTDIIHPTKVKSPNHEFGLNLL